MKKSLLALVLAAALAVPAMAENMWVGGSFSYENSSVSNSDGDGDSNMFTIEPEFGISLDEKWDIGLDLAYGSGKGEIFEVYGIRVAESDQPSIDSYGIAPFARYHIAQVAGVDVMLKGSLFYTKINLKYEYPGDPTHEDNITGYGISITPIISYSINETWSIGAALNFLELAYSHYSDDDSDVKIDNFGFNVNDGALISIGFSYHF